ncbi:MAG: ATP synthase F1 subunit gamma [Lachnospiraceae bacterium]|nr:ATP synthase F1 subunit gamma [Lachnospiraceae bacterium]
MASMRDIKRRKQSIRSTGQITKAMKLVSTVKLQKARGRAEEAKPYFNHLYQTIVTMFDRATPEVRAHYSKETGSAKKAMIVITSNRGLAGGYNSNVVKQVLGCGIPKEDMLIYAVGRKGRDALRLRGYEIAGDYSETMNNPLYSDASDISTDVMDAFENGTVSEIYIAFTVFRNTVSQVPTMLKLMPADIGVGGNEDGEPGTAEALMNFEPDPEEALKLIIPKYVSGEIFGAIMEAYASENGARMQAMDNATNNANDMIEKLELAYNRARQSSITQELTEIIAGANALDT